MSNNTQVDRLFAILDAAAALGSYALLTIFADEFEEEGVAEYAFRLWATAHRREIEEKTDERVIRLVCDGFNMARVTLHLPDVVETREPVPGIVIQLHEAIES